MALLDPREDGPLAYGSHLQLRIAGAESNFAIALSRLGISVSWISRLGSDQFGDLIVASLAAEGVDVAGVCFEPHVPTGAFFKWREGGRSQNLYYRAGSAASRLSLDDLHADALIGVRLVHATGITMALSDSARTLVIEVIRRARTQGAITTFDLNYRPSLWKNGPSDARDAVRDVLPSVDWCLCGLEEGSAVFGTVSSEDLLRAIIGAGARSAVIRVGARGALVAVDGNLEAVAPRRVEKVIDEIGAGDAFAAGFAYGLLKGWSAEAAARAGNLIAAAALRGTGDWETAPHLIEIEKDLLECALG